MFFQARQVCLPKCSKQCSVSRLFIGRYISSINTVPEITLSALKHKERTAIVDHNGVFSYQDIRLKSDLLKMDIERIITKQKKHEDSPLGQRVAFLCPNNASYVITQYAIWNSGAVTVPLSSAHPPNLIQYFLEDSQSTLLITTDDLFASVKDVALRCGVEILLVPKELFSTRQQNPIDSDGMSSDCLRLCEDSQGAHIIYSSGTTGKPKGILASHGNIRNQVNSLITAWNWSGSDSILHVLPLHHLHGILNCLLCPLSVGATCVMLPRFSAEEVWSVFDGNNPKSFNANGVVIPTAHWPNVFMAVPTIYAKLIQQFDKDKDRQLNQGDVIKKLNKWRLMVSGSSSLPEPVMLQWKEISGHQLLERYGMTEIGMALSNPYDGQRIPGSVGKPLPGVEVRIVTDDGNVIVQGNEHGSQVTKGFENVPGELQVKGPSVFSSYWKRPTVTKESFSDDGWFKTGDTTVYSDGNYKILGRASVDIIKKGGYKISALDIERHLLGHKDILDCAVVGLPDPVWGEQIAAVIVTNDKEMSLNDVQTWAKEFLPHYSVPTVLKLVDDIPRNPMGKVNKKELRHSVLNNKE